MVTKRQRQIVEEIRNQPGTGMPLIHREKDDIPVVEADRILEEDLQALVDRDQIRQGHWYEGEVSWHYWPVER